ncbi:MAG: DUF2118 domain-containing protein, partial [Pseudomonadota bacterium]
FLDEATRKAMGEQSVALAKAVDYSSAGTVEFIVDGDRNFYFLEMNTRLQVEHPVTELITGQDLVEHMIRVAYGEKLSIGQDDVKLNGWAMESRLYAEDPYRNFLPSIGRLTRYRPPAETESYVPGVVPDAPVVRNDTGVYEGGEISMYYDPMIAKLCTWGPTRAEAIEGQRRALDEFEVEGIGHNLPFLSAVYDHERFKSGNVTTAFIAEEYPDGFEGAAMDSRATKHVAAASAVMRTIADMRAAAGSGTLGNRRKRTIGEWAVSISGENVSVTVRPDDRTAVRIENGTYGRATGAGFFEVRIENGTYGLVTDWSPGDSLAKVGVMALNGEADWVAAQALNGDADWEAKLPKLQGVAKVSIKVHPITDGFRMRYRGADLAVKVRSPRAAELAALMPEKLPPDTSKMLLCPMPGLVVSIAVERGQEVQEGQALATVEAMKMENVLRAERKGVVAKINADAGDSLAVDDVIMEFE